MDCLRLGWFHSVLDCSGLCLHVVVCCCCLCSVCLLPSPMLSRLLNAKSGIRDAAEQCPATPLSKLPKKHKNARTRTCSGNKLPRFRICIPGSASVHVHSSAPSEHASPLSSLQGCADCQHRPYRRRFWGRRHVHAQGNAGNANRRYAVALRISTTRIGILQNVCSQRFRVHLL